jgi:hypothetical protein
VGAGGHVTVAPTFTVWLDDVYPGADAVMLALPTFAPLTTGWLAGAIWPAAMDTVAGEKPTVVGSELERVTVTPPAGAASGRVIGNGVDAPSPAVTPEGRPIGPAETTVTFAVVSAMNGVALAWMTAVPTATPVTGTLTVVAFAAKLTVAGTVRIVVSLELRWMVVAVGAAADSVSVRFLVFNPVMLAVAGVNVAVAFTWTPATPAEYPGAPAVILTVPMLTPVMMG